MGMGQFKKRGNAKSPITAVITAVITAREYYREAPCIFRNPYHIFLASVGTFSGSFFYFIVIFLYLILG